MGKQLETPLSAPTAELIAQNPSAFNQFLHMSANFTLFGAQPKSILSTFKPVGTHTAHICEANDVAFSTTAVIADGQSGDTSYPFGKIKVLCTVGEYSPASGYMLVGVPDGMGAYLLDSATVRIIWQSESYGTFSTYESFPFVVNPNGASFTGSHVMYVDYDRAGLANFMDNNDAAVSIVKDAGNAIAAAYNLKGQLISKRNDNATENCCSAAPHFSNTNADGCGCFTTINLARLPSRADWIMQSLCSAHLEERLQWGSTGVADTLFITNEEWTSYTSTTVGLTQATGIPAHVLDLATKNLHATGVFTLGGFEKIVEVNCGHAAYVCFSPSGYNGDFDYNSALIASAKNALGLRPDGTPYVNPAHVAPARIYVGVKGRNALGQPATDFLSRNGLAYGKVYGFATNVVQTTGGRYLEDWHKNVALPGQTVVGGFYPIDWRWNGTVTSFLHDGSWAFQHKTSDGLYFWNNGGSTAGSTFDRAASCKTEHNSPDPYGGARFVQSSTCGFFGIYDFSSEIYAKLEAARLDGTWFPTRIATTYMALQGERYIVDQIRLGGKGKYANGNDARYMPDSQTTVNAGIGGGWNTFEDIDGFEWIAAAGTTNGYFVIQEDGGNWMGERTFITKVHTDGTPLTYYFIAMAGGRENTRMKARVGVPALANSRSDAAEFSGVIDLSGMLARDASGNWIATAGVGATKRAAEKLVPINNKTIAMGLQVHGYTGGIINAMAGDRGGQLYAYKPQLPLVDAPMENDFACFSSTSQSSCFAQGVASADPTTGGFVIWSRVNPTCCASSTSCSAKWAVRDASGKTVARGVAPALAANDYTMNVEVHGLAEGRFSYVFGMEDDTRCSRIGQTRTISNPQSIKIAHTSCSNFPHGHFHVYGEMARMLEVGELDAWTHVGDYIYEYGASGYAMGGWAFSGRNGMPNSTEYYSPPNEILTVDDYRLRHKQYLTDPNLMRLRAAGVNVGQIVDDHETANNAWSTGAENHGNGTAGSVEGGVTWAQRKEAGMKAWREFIPTRAGARPNLDGGRTVGYRRFAFGNLVEVVPMDTRNGTAFFDEDAVWALHNPSIFLNGSSFISPFTDMTRLPGFLAARAQMLAIQEARQQFTSDQLTYILDAIRTSTAENVVLLSGTQFMSNMWNYGALTLTGTAFQPALQAVATLPRAVSTSTLGAGTAQLLLAMLYGLYRSEDTTAHAQVQLQQITAACDLRPRGCIILSGDVHNGYVTQLTAKTRELTSPSVSAVGLTQNFVTTLPNTAAATIDGAIAQSLAFDRVNMLQSRVATPQEVTRVLTNTATFGAGVPYATIVANSPTPNVPFSDVGTNGFGITDCVAGQGCSLRMRGVRLGCLAQTPMPSGCVFNQIYASPRA